MDVVLEWAGKERSFRLTLGDVMSLEEACGEAIGAIFARVVGGNFKIGYVYHTIRLALISGGLSVMDAKRLVSNQFDAHPYLTHAAVAGEILTNLMGGIEPSDGQHSDEPQRLVFSEISQICRVFNMSPIDLQEMNYSDFANMIRGYNAGAEKTAEHITEEEFMDILNRYEPGAEE